MGFLLASILMTHARLVRQYKLLYKPMAKNGEWRISTIHRGKTNGLILIKLDIQNYTPQATWHANFDFDTATWVVWANSQFATVFFFFAKAIGRTVRQIWINEGSKRVVPLKVVPFGGLIDVPSNFGGKISQKLKFWGREQDFQA